MPQTLFFPTRGLIYFTDRATRRELEIAHAKITAANDDEFDRLVRHLWWETTAGVRAEADWYLACPPDDVDIARLLADAARVYQTCIDLRVSWFRRNAPQFVAFPGTDTAPRLCLSCSDPLPADEVFGRCRACGTAMHLVFFAADEDITLPARQLQ